MDKEYSQETTSTESVYDDSQSSISSWIHKAQAQVGTHNLRVKYGRQLNQILILRSHQTVVKNIVT